jgi:hypothetical protein
METPLQKLLADTSLGGTRGMQGEIPTNWGLTLTTIRSVPKEAAP